MDFVVMAEFRIKLKENEKTYECINLAKKN